MKLKGTAVAGGNSVPLSQDPQYWEMNRQLGGLGTISGRKKKMQQYDLVNATGNREQVPKAARKKRQKESHGTPSSQEETQASLLDITTKDQAPASRVQAGKEAGKAAGKARISGRGSECLAQGSVC